jgi:tRNA(Ile)-lysidine synthase
MNLLEQFKQHNSEIFKKNTSILLAVSGGLDSMVMLDLCMKHNLSIAIAHCNFMLRGEESNRDETFVISKAKELGTVCHVRKFETQKIAEQQKLSIQETARDLRYAYFEELINTHKYNFLFTAHHQNDNVETVFINMLRGTGSKGLAGIQQKRNKIYRPLLFATRNDIEAYAIQNNITYVEDSSNKKDDYLRNNIRHHLMPVLQNISENALQRISKNSKTIKQEVDLLEWFIEHWCIVNKVQTESGFTIKLNKLLELPSPAIAIAISHIIKPERVDALEVEKFLESNTGSTISTNKFSVLKNRDEIVFRENKIHTNTSRFIIETIENKVANFTIEKMERTTNFVIDQNKNIALLNADKVVFPLIQRAWQHGDTFQPLGMKNKKLVSDFLINNKVSLFDKENVKVLTSNNQIIWVVGMRIDNRFAITESTKSILKIEYSKNI